MKKIFRDLKDKVLDIISMYKQISLDNKNRKLYEQTLDEEFSDPHSEFVKRNLKRYPDTNDIVYVFRIPVEFQESGQEYMIYDKLNESTYFITEFLRNTVGFGDYITGVPEYFHVEDPASDDISLTYVAFWRFQPMITPKLMKKLIWWPVGIVSALAAIITTTLIF